MARYTGPKCRLCRREGEKLFLKGEKCIGGKCPYEKRPYPPGMHGFRRKGRKMSIYGIQLREKQKVKRIYGVGERQFRRYYLVASRLPGNTGENFLSLLERRLDNVVFRLGFAKSRAQARQFVSHGHIRVNGRKVNIPSLILKKGDRVSVDEDFISNPEVASAVSSVSSSALPSWLSKPEPFTGTLVDLPTRIDITHPITERHIVEFYSR
ncbi:MAG: 30S ribosomal protein S4 [candidate division WOR-3 bacterium]